MRKGRQTLCNLYEPNGIDRIDQSETSQLRRLLEKVHKKALSKIGTSLETPNHIDQSNRKLLELLGSWPAVLNRRSQQQTCTTKQSHVEHRATNTPPPNCNYRRASKKTYSSYDGNRDCINIDTNKTEWYIQLASNCYRNGFELHVNHLDECAKHHSVFQREPVPPATPFRLPSSALLSATRSRSLASQVPDLAVRSSSNSIDSHCDKECSNSFRTETNCHRRPHQLNANHFNRNGKHTCDLAHSGQSIGDNARVPIIDIAQNDRPYQKTKQFHALNAKNNMNSVAADAITLPHNLQLTCQTIQYNYPNNNSEFDRESGGEQERHHRYQTNTDNNNQSQWHDSVVNSEVLNNRRSDAVSRPTEDIVNDLIEAFNSSFDVSDANQIKLPQIILSDFSSNQVTPTTTPLLYTVHTSTLSEQPSQLADFHQPNSSAYVNNLRILSHRSF